MGYEVDVRAVGDESQSGDAIAIRYGDLSDPASAYVVIIDGGFKVNGEGLVKHVREVYGTNRVDLVISTHPDLDHISGLTVVLEELEVGELWMHCPWAHSASVDTYVRKGIAGALTEEVQKAIGGAKDLATLAQQKGIRVVEPFTGLTTPDGMIRVMGPTNDYYTELLTDMSDKDKSMARQMYEAARILVKKAIRKLRETWDRENLEEPNEKDVTPRNNSSAIILAQLDTKLFLFTGDAGVPALAQAVGPYNSGLRENVDYLQLPHHGAKRNVGPELLDFLLGPKLPSHQRGQKTGKTAFISVSAKWNGKHPSPRVENAAIRRGARVVKTQGSSHWYHSPDAPDRGWGPLTEVEFNEEYDD